MRLIQHKKEAYWFYRYLSIFYDKLVNPLFWTKRMRDEALELGQLQAPGLKIIDVGSGTGFTTEGIVRLASAGQVTCLDQSPHQMAKAKKKEALQGCTFQLGDAENIPFGTDAFDRYVSAGSIEYWPNPQRGINEAYRVIKPGGIALMIGPLEPENAIARFMANTWMLFPKEEEYLHWFREAGFQDIRVRYVKPHWVTGRGEYGIAISGVKLRPGPSPAAVNMPVEETAEKMTVGRWLQLVGRVLIGSLAGFVFIPAALFGYLRRVFGGQQDDVPEEYRERLNGYQIAALAVIVLVIGLAIYLA
ncbi:MAG: methyltransferase domain-containing protein [Phaeodactylibacter sp.]|nr:methyltransferase domain-containing protein [Phaeodactylibacter sp.]